MPKASVEFSEDWDHRPDVMTTVTYKADTKYNLDPEIAEAAKKAGKLKGSENGKGSGKGSEKSGSGGSKTN